MGLKPISYKTSVTARRFRQEKMKMNDNDNPVLKLLARRDKITDDEWYVLLQARVRDLEDHLRSMSLKPLGELKMLKDYFHAHDLNRDQPDVESVNWSGHGLKTRGIFPSDKSWAGIAKTEHERDALERVVASKHKLWGLTRDAEWIAIEVDTITYMEEYKRSGRFEEVQRAKKVKITRSTPIDLCKFCEVTYKKIWLRLGEVIKDWAEHRKQLYEDAFGLQMVVEQEESLVQAIEH